MVRKNPRGQRLGALLWRWSAGAVLSVALALPLSAQPRSNFFDSFFTPFPNQNRPRPESRTAPADFSRAPAPTRKVEAPPNGSVLVLGDAMADWLAYGLEEGLGEASEFGVIRKHRTASGLLRYESRSETPDWAHVAREIIAAEKPSFIVMMLGLYDRQPIRERAAAVPARGAARLGPAVPATGQPPQPPEQEAEKPSETDNPEQTTNAAPEPAQRSRVAGSHEFRSDKWAELYAKRIDDTIAALKSGGVPVFWVGLPSIRGQRSTGDALYLNELFRARAEKAGIVYIDVWDGFVDEGGRFTLQGPDFEGQIRRLRASDGVYFTKAGARKLAHFVEREIQRASLRGPVTVALPTTEPQPQAPSAKPGGLTARPLAGPVVPLTSAANTGEDGLLGGANARPATDHVTVTRVLVKGESVETPAGRGDDFTWPRRGVAPFGTDPVVATTTLPLPVMQAPLPKTVLAPTADALVSTAAAPRRSARPRQQPPQQAQRAFPSFFPFFR